jgi:hypothetical protein
MRKYEKGFLTFSWVYPLGNAEECPSVLSAVKLMAQEIYRGT